VQAIQDLDLTQEGSFVQEFVHNPLLIDGYKFDIGIYTTLTSVDPLR
jgi:tubulin monoglycylase TTLL15